MKTKMMLLLASLLTCAGALFAQNAKVSGVVTYEADGTPVIGAYVQVKGVTGVGTITDLDGKFELEVPSGTKVLVFSCLGMETKEVAVKSYLQVTMTPDSEMLEGVVVTGMQKMDKRLFTGSTAKVDGDKAKLDGVAEISRALEGRACHRWPLQML